MAAELLAPPPNELGHPAGRQPVGDAEAVDWPLGGRSWRPGDAMQPLGMSGHKKLQDLFVDERIPQAQRGGVALVVDGRDRIVWVVGLRVGELFRVTEKTTRFLKLSATPVA